MKILERFVIVLFSLIVLFCLVAAVSRVFETAGWKPLAAADWAAWFGAVGTIGTLIGTIVLARTETRTREKRESEIAALQGHEHIARLMHAANTMNRVCAGMVRCKRTGFSFHDMTDFVSDLRSIQLWETGEILPLVPLPHGVAMGLARATGDLLQLIPTFETAMQSHSLVEYEKDEDFISLVYMRLVGIAADFDNALLVCLGSEPQGSERANMRMHAMYPQS